MNYKNILEKSYQDLSPLSQRWKKESGEHLFTLQQIDNFFGNINGKRVLDIGCGLGVLVYALTLSGATAEGVDMNILKEWGLEGIPELWKNKNIKVTVDDFFNIQYCENFFDVIITENVFEHLPYKQREFLEKIYKILTPGGCLVLATPNGVSFLKRMRMFFGKSPYWDLEDFYFHKQLYGHFREFTADELKKMAQFSGFETLDVCGGNTYFKIKWLVNLKKIPAFASWALSSIFPAGRDTLFLIAKKPSFDIQ